MEDLIITGALLRLPFLIPSTHDVQSSKFVGINDDVLFGLRWRQALRRRCSSKEELVILEGLHKEFYDDPGTSEEYKAEYPIFKKVHCNGPNTAPIFKFLKSSKTGFLGTRIKWNFTKFLVVKEGRVIQRYGPITTPLSIEADIKKALGEA